MCIAISCLCGCYLTRILQWNGLRTINHSLTSQSHMLQDRNGTTSLREVVEVIRQSFAVRIFNLITIFIHLDGLLKPSAGIETDTILSGISTKISTQTVALNIEETILHGVLLAADEVILVFCQEAVHLRITLHVSHRHHVGRINRLGEAHYQIATILMTEFHNLSKEIQTSQERRIGYRSILTLARLSKSPELLSEIPTQKVRILLEVSLIDLHVVIGEGTASTTGTLNHGPDTVLGANLHPGVAYLLAIRTGCLCSRERKVEHHVWLDVLWHHIDDALWVRIIPGINVDNPHRL